MYKILFCIFASRFLFYNIMKVKEIIYIVLDRIKGTSDDFSYTEEHILFLINKYRSYMLKQTYKDVKKEISYSNYQTICLDLETENKGLCQGIILRSKQEIPNIINISKPILHTEYENTKIVFTNRDRFRFVGSNKFLRNILYSCIGENNKLLMKSNNPQYLHLKSIKLEGVFEDFEKAFELSCNSNKQCDILDAEFPFEDSLVPQMCDSIYNVLTNSIYKPKDDSNDANDTLANLANYLRNNMKSDLQKQIDG